MAIVDGRTSLDTWESNQPDNLAGSAGGTADTEIFIEGSQSYGYYTTSSRAGLLYDAGSAQDWSNNTFYLWVNCGIAGLLHTKANGGLAVRFCGNTVSNWFEVYVAGSDSYPDAVQGGWVMLVVDIEKAKTASDATNGTPPGTNAIRYVGISTVTGGTMPRMADNTWLDAMWRLPANTAGIRVEGQASGPADWTWQDIADWAATNSTGTCRVGPGGSIVVNTPIQFGANDASTHGFSDTNKTILWGDWDVDPNFYGLTVIGGSGTQSFKLGIKTGTGDDASGAQGCVIQAASSGERWFFDCDDSNIDTCSLYGCVFIHGDDFQLDNANTSVISCSFIDCSSATITDCADFLRCSVIDAATADGAAFAITDDIGDIVFCSFEFSDGHAVELTTPRVATQTSKGNQFIGYGAIDSNDAAVYNNTAGAVTINVTDGGSTPTYRDGASASTTVDNPVTHTVNGLSTNERVVWIRVSDEAELENQPESSGEASYQYNYVSDTPVYVSILSVSRKIRTVQVTLDENDAVLPASLVTDVFYSNP